MRAAAGAYTARDGPASPGAGWRLEGLRVVLLVGHLVGFALAMSAVLRGDWMVLNSTLLEPDRLREVSQQVRHSLWLLVSTGIALVAIDTGLDAARILGSPKLLAKLSVIAVLLVNAGVLHGLAFPALFSRRPGAASRAGWVSLAGAVSGTSWMFATFLGVARPLALRLGYGGFMALYLAALACAGAVAWIWVRPRIRRLMQQRADADAAPRKPESLSRAS